MTQKHIILIDSSYTSFHRFFATLRWLSFTNKEMYMKYRDDPLFDWSTEPLFIEKYKKMYIESIIRLVTPAIYNNSILLFCLDSPQSTLWRHKFSSEYKPAIEELSPVLASLCDYVRESVEERQCSGTYNLTPTWRILAAQATSVFGVRASSLRPSLQHVHLRWDSTRTPRCFSPS